MPAKKQQRNGFYWFMKHMQEERRLNGENISMEKILPFAHPKWKEMSLDDRKPWEQKAKDERAKGGQVIRPGAAKPDSQRLDSQGENLCERDRLERQKVINRKQENNFVKETLHALSIEDILNHKFYFVHFEYLCCTPDGDYLPVEIGLLEFSLEKGIINFFHDFIDPGDIPLGYRNDCQTRSADRHHIPIESFARTTVDFNNVWSKISKTINRNGSSQYPFVFAQDTNVDCARYAFSYIYKHTLHYGPNPMAKRVLTLEFLLQHLHNHPGLNELDRCEITEMSARNSLLSSTHDFTYGLSCEFHMGDNESRHCALSYVKRYAYAFSESLNEKFGFNLTPTHLPVVQSLSSKKRPLTKGFGASSSNRQDAFVRRDDVARKPPSEGSITSTMTSSRYTESLSSISSEFERGGAKPLGATGGVAPQSQQTPFPPASGYGRGALAQGLFAGVGRGVASTDDAPPQGLFAGVGRGVASTDGAPAQGLFAGVGRGVASTGDAHPGDGDWQVAGSRSSAPKVAAVGRGLPFGTARGTDQYSLAPRSVGSIASSNSSGSSSQASVVGRKMGDLHLQQDDDSDEDSDDGTVSTLSRGRGLWRGAVSEKGAPRAAPVVGRGVTSSQKAMWKPPLKAVEDEQSVISSMKPPLFRQTRGRSTYASRGSDIEQHW